MRVSCGFFRIARFATAAYFAAHGIICVAAEPAPSNVLVPEWYQSEVYSAPESGVTPASRITRMEEGVAEIAADSTPSGTCCEASTGCTAGCCDYTSGCCGGASNGCCDPGWCCYAGTEFTFLVPVIDEGSLGASVDDNGTATGVAFAEDTLRDMEFAPRLWVGAKRDCWGIVSRFWFLDACATESTFDQFTDNFVGSEVRADLEMYTIDLELTRDICWMGYMDVVSAGLRYASYDHSAQLMTIADVVDDSATYSGLSAFTQSNRGLGLTSSLSGARPICGTCFSTFYAARASVLWGDNNVSALTQTSVNDGGGNQVAVLDEAGVSTDDPFGIFEFQLGLQAQYRLKCYPASAFLRTAFEYQHWTGDSGTAAALGTGSTGASQITTGTVTEGLDLNLYGFSVATGLTF